MNKHTHDPLLRDLARKFLTLPSFPDADQDRALALFNSGANLKHVAPFPAKPGATLVFGVRYFIAGRTRFFASARMDQLDDAIRFADACTLRFWKYRERNPDKPNPVQFNYGEAAAQADLDEWADIRPDIIALMDEIEQHLLEVEVFAVKSSGNRQAPEFNRKTVRGELQFINWQLGELANCLDEFFERMRH